MNNYEDWAQLVAKRLKGEADLIAAIEKDELNDTAANEAFVRAVLEPFLPENFGVGSGRIVDAFGNQSEHIDIVVYNRDFPRIGMLGASNAYLYESVLAVFSVRAKFIRKTFFDSLNACASLARLETNIDKAVLVKLAKKNGLKPAPNKKFVHEDPLRTARFELIGRPPAFVFGFSGIKHSYRQLQENVELWLNNRREDAIETPMKALPAVIATQGCFAWRNAAPLALSNRELLGIGNDDAPVRLIVLQLLYLLNRRLNVTADGYGLKPSLNAYLSQFSAPNFEIGVGDVADLINLKKSESAAADPGTISARYEPAKDHSPVVEAVAEAVPELPQEIAAPADDLQAADQADVFDKPSPFASSPVPPAATPTPVSPVPPPAAAPAPVEPETNSQAAGDAAVFDKPSPFASTPVKPVEDSPPAAAQRSPVPAAPLGSAPIPPMGDSTATSAAVEKTPPRTPLGSAPIPPMQDSAPAAAPLGSAPVPAIKPAASAAESRPAASTVPPKPPVDFDLGSADDDANEDKAEAEEDQFINTVVIPPNAAASSKKAGNNSTDAFIARVKEQLSTPEQMPANKKDFSSTIPQ